VLKTLLIKAGSVRSSVAPRTRTLALLLVPLFFAGCADSTLGVQPCVLTPLDPRLSITISNPAVLQPLLADAVSRLIPSVTDAPVALAPSFVALNAELGAVEINNACRAFNAATEVLAATIATSPAANTPDLAALRLSLRLVHAWLASISE